MFQSIRASHRQFILDVLSFPFENIHTSSSTERCLSLVVLLSFCARCCLSHILQGSRTAERHFPEKAVVRIPVCVLPPLYRGVRSQRTGPKKLVNGGCSEKRTPCEQVHLQLPSTLRHRFIFQSYQVASNQKKFPRCNFFRGKLRVHRALGSFQERHPG